MSTNEPNGVIYLSNVRLSFPNLVEPQETTDPTTGKKRISYNCDLLMPPDHGGFAQFMQRYASLAQEEWKANAGQAMQMVQAERKQRCYGQGSEKINKKTFQPYDGYAGMVYLSAGSRTPPQMIQADGKPIDPANTMAYQALARKMYGGCRVNVAVKPWLQKNQHGLGVRCDLIALQFAGDDQAFGAGQTDVTGVFGAVAQPATPHPAGVPMPTAPFPGLPPFMTGGQ